LGEKALEERLKEFKGSHTDYLIAESLRLKYEREAKLKIKEEEELTELRPKPDISSKYRS
jgi:hypothetical protein